LSADQIERALRARKHRREGDVERKPLRLQLAAGGLASDALFGEIGSFQPVNRFFRFHSLWP
jgi:hypothetical protein